MDYIRKYTVIITFLFLSVLLVGCGRKDEVKRNFLGGYGDIYGGTYSNAYVSALFEDDVYIYCDKYKINKNSGKYVDLCENPGCKHDTPDCIEYLYGGNIFPGKDIIFYASGKELYSIDIAGNTRYIDTFDIDEAGIKLDESLNIELVRPLNDNCLFISIGNGTCFYKIDTKERLYAYSLYICANDDYIFYYDDGIYRIKMDDWSSEKLDNTSYFNPCVCVDDKLYCNTVFGTICSINSDGTVNLIMADEEINYKLVEIKDNRMLYYASDEDSVTGRYTYCDLYCSNMDGAASVKVEINNLAPGIYGDFFIGEEKLYMLSLDYVSTNINEIYDINLGDGSMKNYKNQLNTTDENVVAGNQEGDNGDLLQEMNAIKGFDICLYFHREIIDPMTGYVEVVPQRMEPFILDGNQQKTVLSYQVDVRGAYPKDGYINIFVMCDGIIQMSSVNGGEDRLINQIQYMDGELLTATLEFNIENASPDGRFWVCYYFADSAIEDNFEDFTSHKECISFSKFAYRLADGYSLDYSSRHTVYSNYRIEDVYTLEEHERWEDVYRVECLSDCIPVGRQKENWFLDLEDSDILKLVFHNTNGQYNIVLLIDDIPISLSEENTLLFDINGEYDTVVYEIDVKNIICDGEKHIAKIVFYDRNTGIVDMSRQQIIQVK
ncbi:MAG: hypothetical protein ACI4D8_07960 [Wujia sp.]